MLSNKFPTLSQWKQFFKVLKKGEKRLLIIFSLLAIISGSYLLISFYYNHTIITPAYKGNFREGIVGQPRFINPVYGETNDVDRTLINLIYSGLMKYDNQGNIVPDLAQSYSISEDGKTYTFELKNHLYWHDGTPLTVEDIIYTVKVVQNSDYKSPLRASWLNVETKKISEKSLSFILKTPYSSFLENTTLKIIPKHIWEKVEPENFALSHYNLQPIGSGPYLLSEIEQEKTGFIQSITLKVNKRYYDKIPFIKTISFKFFKNEEDLLKAVKQKKIDGFSEILAENFSFNGNDLLKKEYIPHSFFMPRYFAVFFNTQKSKIFSDKNITQALAFALNKEEIVKNLKEEYKKEISIVNSPLLPEYYNFSQPKVIYDFDIEKSEKLLENSGYKKGEDGKRIKINAQKPSFQFKSYLKVGSKGKEVTELHSCLIRLDSELKEILKENPLDTFTKKTEEAVTIFQKKYLPDSNPTGETGPATRKKLNELCFKQPENYITLGFTLTTVNQPILIQTANLLKSYWEKMGVDIKINAVQPTELKEIIKKRDYEALLYGQALGTIPDPYPFWHSSQVNDPGLNLSGYQNKNVDQLLKEIREDIKEGNKKQKYEKLQDLILTDSPAIFLYNINYLYWTSSKVKGVDTYKIIDPSQRFSNINYWYIITERTWKQK